MNVSGKSVIVTGAGGGLGSAIADLLCRKGGDVYLLELDEQKGKERAEQLQAAGGKARFIHADVTREEDWRRAVELVVATSGKLDVLVNNAGINIRKPLEDMSIEEWDTMMRVNTGSVFLGCKYAIPVMRKQGGGAIINMSSVCGLIGHRYTPEAYTASKGAVTLLTKAVASRYGKEGIRCNSVHPSTVATPLVEAMMSNPQWVSERFGEVPLGRLASEADVAHAVLYLASDEAAFLNGVALPVDGGTTCY